MKKITFFFTLLFVFSVSAYPQTKAENADELLNATVWMQRSGEYKALTEQAFNIGTLRLSQILIQDSCQKPKAIVLDIDETVLDNSPFEAYEILQKRSFKKEDWDKWVKKADAEPLSGALRFLNFAKDNGVQAFYVTNRDEKERAATLLNLQKKNFPFADNEHLILKSEKSSSKESRRQKIAQTYSIVLFFGDNLNDFSDIYYYANDGKSAAEKVTENPEVFGQKYIILPNAMYGDWEKEINKRFPQKGLSPKDKKIKALQSFE